MKFRKVLVVINPASGNDEPILNTLNDVFSAHEIEWDARITKTLGDGEAYARQAVAEGYDLVMAYGGDGTQLDVANGLLGSTVPLAVLHGGTANALATELKIPRNLEKAVNLPFQNNIQIAKVDLAEIDGRHFLLRIGTGMLATLQEAVTRELKDQYGIGAYFLGGVQSLNNPQQVTYHLTIDGQEIESTGIACLVTNMNELGVLGLKLSPHIVIDDGLLDVFVLKNDLQSVLSMLSSVAQWDVAGMKIDHWQAKEIHIHTEPSQGIYADGETQAFAHTPCTVRIVEQSLAVIVPST